MKALVFQFLQFFVCRIQELSLKAKPANVSMVDVINLCVYYEFLIWEVFQAYPLCDGFD